MLSKTSSTNTDYFDYKTFVNYLQGIVDGNRSQPTAKSITNDVQTFMTYSYQGSKTTDVDLLFNRKAIEVFVYLKIINTSQQKSLKNYGETKWQLNLFYIKLTVLL